MRFFLFCLLFWVFAIGTKAFCLDHIPVSGTPERLEKEFKIAYWLPKKYPLKKVFYQIEDALKKALKEKNFRMEEFLDSKYYLDKKFQTFAFKDVYFDTTQDDILQERSSYRLRYRWDRYEKYLRYKLFPFLSLFYPSRCEVQFKRGYKLFANQSFLTVRESRFEFRNESMPFMVQKNAPQAPWSLKKYMKFAQQGRFKDYRMLPYQILRNSVDESKKIKPKLEVLTQRTRSHLNMHNPWGSQPNPYQAFIVTVDKSVWSSLDASLTKKQKTFDLLEIEIELERNISTFLESSGKKEFQKEMSALDKDVLSQLSRRSLDYLTHDLKTLSGAVSERLYRKISLEQLPLDFKYARMRRTLEPVQ